MFYNRKYFGLAILITLIFSFGCGTKRNRPPARVVPIAINIKSQNNHDLNFVDMNYYRLKVLDDIDDFLPVNLNLVEPDENPEVILDLNIDNFVLWPRDERTSRRTMSRSVQVGTDQAGKPVYQTVTASVDITEIQRRSNARFVTTLTFKGEKPKTFKQNFSSNYNYTNTYVDNIRGDQRAVDPRLYSMQNLGIEPREDDFLLQLSKRDMLPRISNELRSYYK